MLRGIITFGIGMLFSAGAAAQDSATEPDPAMNTLPALKEQTPLAAWGLAALFLISSLAIAFKNSKRGHLD